MKERLGWAKKKVQEEEEEMSAGKVKEVAVEEAERIKTLTSDAVRSGAYLYPVRVSKVFSSSCSSSSFNRLKAIGIIGIELSKSQRQHIGNSILHLPPLSVETTHIQTGPHHQSRHRHHNIHVRLRLSSANGSHGNNFRPPGSPYRRHPRPV